MVLGGCRSWDLFARERLLMGSLNECPRGSGKTGIGSNCVEVRVSPRLEVGVAELPMGSRDDMYLTGRVIVGTACDAPV